MSDSNSSTAEAIAVAISSALAAISYLVKIQADLARGQELDEAGRADLDAKIADIPNVSHWQIID